MWPLRAAAISVHLGCAECGVFVGALCEADGPRAVVNADLFEALRDRDSTTADFEGEEVTDRLARRARTWTPVLRVGQ